MTILYINTGTGPNKGDGDTLRTAFNKINLTLNYLDSTTLTSSSLFISNLQSSISTVAYSIPTVISSLTNDLGYITSSSVVSLYVNKAQLKTIAATSTSFIDFQYRISLL